MIPLAPAHIALVAPTYTDLWRYERALEREELPIASQAGKGLFRRQEVQDLLALTRALADARDTLGLGALMRGPLVGLTEEELLDITAALPVGPDRPDALPRLLLLTDPSHVQRIRSPDASSPYSATCGAARDIRPRRFCCPRRSSV